MANEMTKREGGLPEAVEQERYFTPPVDIYENDNELLVQADMPGVTGKSLRVDVDRDQLSIEGTVAEEPEGAVCFREHMPGRFRRRFQLPGGLDVNKIAAELRHGVLTVHLPKAEAYRPRRIEVRPA